MHEMPDADSSLRSECDEFRSGRVNKHRERGRGSGSKGTRKASLCTAVTHLVVMRAHVSVIDVGRDR
jgi:hypothetical protein